MTCTHTPSSPIAAFWHTCKHCGLPIEPVFCKACDGTGAKHGATHRNEDCPKCKGTGVKKWEKAE